jgi:DNA-binding NtrC family response regulator
LSPQRLSKALAVCLGGTLFAALNGHLGAVWTFFRDPPTQQWNKIMATASVILVVENNPDERESIMRTLDPDRFHVVGADNPNDAIAYADDSVDLVISELRSRELDGLELLRKWKQRHPNTPFVLVTDGNDVNSVVEAMKLGAADCILRPLDFEKLRTLVSDLLDRTETNGLASPRQPEETTPPRSNIDIPPGTSLEDLERAAVEQALAQHQGNRTHAAKTLGISVRTLQRKLKAWGMPTVSGQNSNPSPHFIMPTHHASSSPFSAHAM